MRNKFLERVMAIRDEEQRIAREEVACARRSTAKTGESDDLGPDTPEYTPMYGEVYREMQIKHMVDEEDVPLCDALRSWGVSTAHRNTKRK